MTNEEALRILHCPSAYLTDEDSEFAHTIPLFSKAYGQAMAVAFEALKYADVLDKIKAEIMEKFEGCEICKWFEDYDYEENNVSEYHSVGNISDIIGIIDKYKAESEGKC